MQVSWQVWRWWKRTPRRKDRAARYTNPGIVAFYWDGGAPKQHVVKDISLTGAYLHAADEYCTGTVLELALQQDIGDAEAATPLLYFSAPCRVLYSGADEMRVRFILPTRHRRKALERFIDQAVAARQARENSHGTPVAGPTLIRDLKGNGVR